jgi:hypothetical protein
MGRGLIRARLLLLAVLLTGTNARAITLPPIIATADNAVPGCVTPAALMQFVTARNAKQQPPLKIEPRFHGIATLYQEVGQCVARPPHQCVGVRWDYAFFQMLIETNYLTFLRPDGAPASVVSSDNNFAGVGAAISGKPGERFTDVATGVLAHLQHILMYSTTRIPEPVAKRTRQVQDDVQAGMRRLHRPVTFSDLARVGPARARIVTDRDSADGGEIRKPQLRASRNQGTCLGGRDGWAASMIPPPFNTLT